MLVRQSTVVNFLGERHCCSRGEYSTKGSQYRATRRISLPRQQAIRSVFDAFRRIGSAFGVAREFRQQRWQFSRLIRPPGADQLKVSNVQQKQVVALATNFPQLGNDPGTADRDRKRMVRLLIEDVTIRKGEQVQLDVRVRGDTLRPAAISSRMLSNLARFWACNAPYPIPIEATPANIRAAARSVSLRFHNDLIAKLRNEGMQPNSCE
jgi:hypothetical protein